ncbi:MAG TPA: GH1 family beta-glucosidase [Spirochaetia bacterium]|nr:GH1 family beta-glucosidase [Spirochaetia bacterium]
MSPVTFPKGFLWGASTAAYQIEGYPLADGASPSIWHEFVQRTGAIRDGTTGDIACDHYHRYAEDVGAMSALGLNAYRFSIAWPRILPEPGRVNPKGLDFYSRLVDCLLEAGITPYATLFHWDVPTWLEEEGGLVERTSVDHLVRYAETVVKSLGDRVRHWITINEPTIFALFGYITGEYPPGRTRDLRAAFRAIHFLLLAHARQVRVLRALAPGAEVGLAHHFVWIDPRDPRRRRDVRAATEMDDFANHAVLESLVRGTYPPTITSRVGRFLPKGFERDLQEMGIPGDFIGMNYYTRQQYRHALLMPYLHAREYTDPSAPRSAMWEIHPDGMYRWLVRLRDRYGNPRCIVTESGFPLPDVQGRDPLDDPERISYLTDHIARIGKAIQEGARCEGYFHWSLLDNFEWSYGTIMRFGLLRTDFDTQKRSWKRSAYWYRDLVRANALPADGA